MNGGEVKFYFKGDTKELTKSVNTIDWSIVHVPIL